MSILSETELRKILRNIGNTLRLIGDVAGLRDGAGTPIKEAGDREGAQYFDTVTHNLYLFTKGAWVSTGIFEWVRYAVDITGKLADGTLDGNSVVNGFTDTISTATKWKGVATGQITSVESTNPQDYTWEFFSDGLLKDTAIDLDSKPPSPLSFLAVDELYYTNVAGGIKSRVVLTWGHSTGAGIVDAESNIIFFKKTADPTYEVWATVFGTTSIITDLSPDNYDFKVVALSKLNVASDATEITGQVVAGLTAAPQNVQNVFLNVANGQAILRWDTPTDLDVLSGGHVEIRHSPNIDADVNWNNSQVISQSISGQTTTATTAALIGTYTVKFVDSTGNESPIETAVTNRVVPSGFNAVATDDQQPLFSGAKVGATVVDGKLDLNVDTTKLEYTFANFTDLKEVISTRVEPTYKFLAYDLTDTFCVIANVCDRPIMCRGQVFVDFIFFISTTDDDPSSNDAVWTPYERLITREVTARALRFRVTAEIQTGGEIRIEELGMNVDAPDVVSSGSSTSTSTGDTTVSYPTDTFYTGIGGTSKPSVSLTIIGGSAGDSYVIATSTAAGFTYRTYDSSNTQVIRTIDFQAIGI